MRSAARLGLRALSFMRLAVLSIAIALTVPISGGPAVAAERGLVTGRVVNETTGRPATGARVTLSGADEDGSARVRKRVTVDDDGRYRFEGLPAGSDWLFVIDAEFDGGLFPGRAFAFPRDEKPELQTTIKVWNTTSDPNSVLITRDAMFVLPAEEGIGVVESVNILNQTRFAYVGRGEKSTFGFGLPPGAAEVAIQDASVDVPELVETDFGFGITVAIPPGETDLTYSFRIPENDATYVLSKTALYPTTDLLVFVDAPLELAGDRLKESGTVTVEGKRYRRWIVPGIVEAGDTLLIQAEARASMSWLPFSIGAVAIVGVIGLAYAFARRRGHEPRPAPPESRVNLIEAIASLDVAYENGSMAKERYEAERARLKSLLVETEKA